MTEDVKEATAVEVMEWVSDGVEWWHTTPDGAVLRRTPVAVWDPVNNANDRDAVVEAMLAKGWHDINIWRELGMWTCEMHHEDGFVGFARDERIGVAVSQASVSGERQRRAALAAVRGGTGDE